MEHLTKYQVLLLMLLVSFVTAVTTGIVTVSLVDQNTPSVPQVVNRVVERTIEKVATSDQPAAVATKETVIVRSEDEGIMAIEKNIGSIVSLYSVIGESRKQTFLGFGFFVSKSGRIVTDPDIVSAQVSLVAATSQGKLYPVQLEKMEKGDPIAFLDVVLDHDQKVTFPSVILAKSAPRLGQNILSFGGKSNPTVSTGIVSEIVYSTATTTPAAPIAVNTDVNETASTLGSPLVNLSGEVIGIKTALLNPAETTASVYLPSSAISLLLVK